MTGRSDPRLNQQENHSTEKGKCKPLSSLCKQHEGALEQNLRAQQGKVVVLLM